MKDGKFEKGDRLECVEEIGNLRKGKIYICSGYSGVYDNITLEDKDGGFFYRRFKLAKLEPAPFIPEYFSALNEKDGEKYIGKVMEFADRKGLKHFEWEKGIFININHEANAYSFESLNSSGFQFMRTCPETFVKRKVKKTVECWVNIYIIENKVHWTKPEAERCATPDRIACVKLTGDYEVEE